MRFRCLIYLMAVKITEAGEGHGDFLRDESRMEGRAERIGFPTTTAEVCEALAIARQNGWPVTVQGGRTGITGGCVPEGGLILNLSRMNRIGPVEGHYMTVQPGAALDGIRRAVTAGSGNALFFPPDPTETTATIGGMVSTNASGARSFRYGPVRRWIHAIEVVLPNGEAVGLERGVQRADGRDFQVGHVTGRLPELPHLRRCGSAKHAAGYVIRPDMDLVDLFIGAEGTLGVVTSITLALRPRPEMQCGLTAFFASEGQALVFVRSLREAMDAAPTAIEFFDDRSLELLRRMKSSHPAFAGLPELRSTYHTAIYFEYDRAVPDAAAEAVERQAVACWLAEGEDEIGKMKNFRHALPEAVNLLIAERRRTLPTLTKLGTDLAAPDDRLEAMMEMYRSGLTEAGVDYVIFGHIGNNHVHVNVLPRSLEEAERAKALHREWARQMTAWGGSVAAEHGIGKSKRELLELMAGADGIEQMRQLKARFDPAGLLNPGNLFHPAVPVAVAAPVQSCREARRRKKRKNDL